MGWLDSAIGAGGLIGGSLISAFGGKDSVNQVPLETPEQADARKKLLDFAKTGKLGSYSVGDLYKDDLGNFSLTPIEQFGQNKLYDYMNSASPELFQLGNDSIKGLLNSDSYDPYSSTGVYSGFKRNVEKNLREGTDRIKREAAFSKNLYSSNTIDRIGDLEEEGQQQLTNKLAELYDLYSQRKISAIPLALNAGLDSNTMDMNKIGAAYQYGSLPRLLETAKSQADYQDWLRARTELKEPIQALESVVGSSPNYGFPSVPIQNPWAQLLNTVGQIGLYRSGNYLGGQGANFYSGNANSTPYTNGGNIMYG